MIKRAMTSFAGLALLATMGLACSSDDDEADTTEAVDETDAPDETEAAPDETEAAPEETEAASDTTAAAEEPAAGGEFSIEGFAFQEGFVGTAGQPITVVNADGTTHTVTSADFSIRVNGGGEETLTVDAPGEYAIFCEIHPSMTGTITIE